MPLERVATRPRRPWGWYTLVGVLAAIAGHAAGAESLLVLKLVAGLAGVWGVFCTLMAARPTGHWRIRGKAPALGQLGVRP